MRPSNITLEQITPCFRMNSENQRIVANTMGLDEDLSYDSVIMINILIFIPVCVFESLYHSKQAPIYVSRIGRLKLFKSHVAINYHSH